MEKIDYTVKKTNLYEQIANKLERAIIRSGETVKKLPSEQELSRNFNVSRTVIREALKVLKERGLVQPRNGEGSYISRPDTGTVSSAIDRIIQMDNINNDNLHDTRLTLETAVAPLSARNIKDGELERLESIINEMSDLSLSQDKRIALDAEFHITIARAAGNELLRMFVEVMTILLREYMTKGISGVNGMRETLTQHKKIFLGLKARDPAKTEKAVRNHLAASRANVEKFETGSGAAKEEDNYEQFSGAERQ